jgi:hypothetical protein
MSFDHYVIGCFECTRRPPAGLSATGPGGDGTAVPNPGPLPTQRVAVR